MNRNTVGDNKATWILIQNCNTCYNHSMCGSRSNHALDLDRNFEGGILFSTCQAFRYAWLVSRISHKLSMILNECSCVTEIIKCVTEIIKRVKEKRLIARLAEHLIAFSQRV